MLNKTIAILLIGVCAVGALAAPLHAQQDEAEQIRQLLEERDRAIKAVLGNKDTFTEQQREKLKTMINDVIDFRALSQQALGPFWDDLTPEQQSEFVDTFGEIVRSQSLADLNVYRSEVTYEEINVEGDSAYVKTSTVYKNTPIMVEYILGREDDTWRATNIIIDEVGTAESYARSFQTVIRKKGYDALRNSLQKKLDEIRASS